MFPLLWLMKTKLLFMMMMIVDDCGGDGENNGDGRGDELRLKPTKNGLLLQMLKFDSRFWWEFN